jgi:hypothetical protein
MLINEPENVVKQATADALQEALRQVGHIDPSEEEMEAHAIVLENGDGLDYYWDDELLISTRPLMTCGGVQIIRKDKP